MSRRKATQMNLFSFQDIIMSVMGILLLITLFLALFLVTPSAANQASQEKIEELEASMATAVQEADELHSSAVSLRLRLAKARAQPTQDQLASDLKQLQDSHTEETAKLDDLNQQLSGLEAARREEITKLGLDAVEEEIGRIKEQARQVRLANGKDEAAVAAQEQRVAQARESLNTLKRDANKLWLIPSASGNSKEPLLVTVSDDGIELNRFNRPEDRHRFPAADAVSGLRREMAGMNAAKDYVLFYIRPSGVDLFRKCKEVTDGSRFQIGFDAVEETAELVFTRELE